MIHDPDRHISEAFLIAAPESPSIPLRQARVQQFKYIRIPSATRLSNRTPVLQYSPKKNVIVWSSGPLVHHDVFAEKKKLQSCSTVLKNVKDSMM